MVLALLLVTWLVLSPLPSRLVSWPRRKQSSHNGEGGEDKGPSAGYILPVLIHHARMLPKESQHAFRYPSLFLAMNLAEMELGKANGSRLFSWQGCGKGKGSRWSITTLNPEGFGRRTFADVNEAVQRRLATSMLLKLLYELRLRNYLGVGPQDAFCSEGPDEAETASGSNSSTPWHTEVGQVWAVAMPHFLGMGGFNPLTVYYVYRPSENGQQSRGKLWLVVLEVHNTFNERHVYICQVGVQEDDTVRRGYQHSWTFPRAFHVSPFNDRSGYYQLMMSDLWTTSPMPTLDIRLLLLVPEEEQELTQAEADRPRLQKKLLATLTSSKATSASLRPLRAAQRLHATAMMAALLHQPLDLLLPVSRIMWQAAKLHWKRNLPVYIRPEPRGQGLKEEVEGEHGRGNNERVDVSCYDGLGWPEDLNPTQRQQKASSSSGAIYWNQDSFVEQASQAQFERFARQQTSKHDDLSICVVTRNAEVQPSCFYKGQMTRKVPHSHGLVRTLTIYTLSSSLYLDFALYPPAQARLFGSLVDRNWGVSSVADYNRLFCSPASTHGTRSRKSRIAAWARRAHLQWAIRASERSDKSDAALLDDVASHPYDTMDAPLPFLIALLTQLLLIRLTAALSTLLHVRYVRRPWAQVGEGLQRLRAEK